MKKFEYLHTQVFGPNFVQKFDEFGVDGWELVHIGHNNWTWWKREVINEPETEETISERLKDFSYNDLQGELNRRYRTTHIQNQITKP
jgi:hypothetical protein